MHRVTQRLKHLKFWEIEYELYVRALPLDSIDIQACWYFETQQ